MKGPAFWRAGTPGTILRGRWFDTPGGLNGEETEFEISLGSEGPPDREPTGWKGYQLVADDTPSLENYWDPLLKRRNGPDDGSPVLVNPADVDLLKCLELLEGNAYVFCDARDVGDYFLRALHTFPFRGWLQTSDQVPPYYQPDRQPYGRTGADPTLVFTHGYTGNPGNWTHLTDAFGDSDCGYAVPLLAGHGLSPEEFGRFDEEDWIKGFERELEWLKRFSHDTVGIGLSMGGALNLIHWDYFEAVVLINTPYYVPDWRRFFLPVMQWLRTYHHFDESDKTIPVKSLLSLRNLLARGRNILDDVSVPVLVINHRPDPTVTVGHGLRYKNELPNADHRVLEEGTHESPTDPDVAQILRTIIMDWLTEKGFSL